MKRLTILILGSLLLQLLVSMTVWAEPAEIRAVLMGEDENYGYRYECQGIGGFSTNISGDGTDELAIFSLDPGVKGILYRDGFEEPFGNDAVLFDSGSYELYLYPEGQEDPAARGSFFFTINSLFGEDSGEFIPNSPVNPKLDIEYDRETDMYTYTLPNRNTFSMNVPLGAVTRNTVSLSITKGDGVYDLRKDGKALLMPDVLVFSEPGTYQLQMLSSYSGADAIDTGIYRVEISFKIIPDTVKEMDILNAPVDFAVKSVTRDRKQIRGERTYVYLEQDGSYRAEFAWEEDPRVVYETGFKVDRTAPYLIFSEDIYEASLKPPITFRPSENGCRVTVYCNGIQSPGKEYAITSGGSYLVTISDEVGNERRYSLNVSYKSDLFQLQNGIILLVLLAAGAAWMLYQRRNMRVL